jgi:hypothetical protein
MEHRTMNFQHSTLNHGARQAVEKLGKVLWLCRCILGGSDEKDEAIRKQLWSGLWQAAEASMQDGCAPRDRLIGIAVSLGKGGLSYFRPHDKGV